MRDDLGIAIEARFVLNGRYVLVLDKYAPYLRLFTAEGRHLWSGGQEGGGPTEFHFPLAIAVNDDEILAFQRARITRWAVADDSLVFIEAIPIPPHYLPRGAVRGCEEGWLFYARNDLQYKLSGDSLRIVKNIEFLHSLRMNAGSATIRPIWSGPRDYSTFSIDGHAGVSIARFGERIAIMHRPTGFEAGSVLEFDCQGSLLHTYSEWSLITGDTVEVKFPRPRALQWTSGILAFPGGVATALHRWFESDKEGEGYYFKTEIFRFLNGEYAGSVVVPGQWQLMDYDTALGGLLTTDAPVPHFIVIRGDLLFPGKEKSE